MDFEDQVDFLIEHLDQIPDDSLDRAISILVQAGEIDLAASLARDRGLIDRAIEILVEAGDYLWAALMAKNAGREKQSEQLYRQGLGFYVDRGMFGRAVAAATALKLPQDEIDALFIKGVETESQYLDPEQARAMVSELVPDLEISLACWNQQASQDAIEALKDYRARLMEGEMVEWPMEASGNDAGVADQVLSGSAPGSQSQTSTGSTTSQSGSGSKASRPRESSASSTGSSDVPVKSSTKSSRGSSRISKSSSGASSRGSSTSGSNTSSSSSSSSDTSSSSSSSSKPGGSKSASSGSSSASQGASGEEYARWRTGSDRGMRSADGTGRLSYLDETGSGR